MKIFSIVGLALAANSMLVNGLAIKGLSAPRLSIQAQQEEALSALSGADLPQQEEAYPPSPYEFSFDTNSDGSSSSRQETGDGSGKVFGKYAIKGADGRERIVSYTADAGGFHANVTTNELGTESKNPSFVVFKSSQLPAAEISRQLQTEVDLAQQEEQPAEEQPAELPVVPVQKSIGTPPRKSSSLKSTAARRPAQQPVPQQRQVSLSAKSRRPSQQSQQVSAPSKRPISASPSKGTAARRPSKTVSVSAPTTQRPKPVSAPPSKRPVQLKETQLEENQEEEAEAPAQLNLNSDQTEETLSANEDESQDF